MLSEIRDNIHQFVLKSLSIQIGVVTYYIAQRSGKETLAVSIEVNWILQLDNLYTFEITSCTYTNVSLVA